MKITSILPVALVGMLSTSAFADDSMSNYKFLPESQVATITLLNQGADLISTVGMRNAIDVAHSTNGTGVFAAASTGYSVYETGSHINTFGNSAMVGGATRLGHNIVLGGFAEGGYSHYHTTNASDVFGEIKGAGNIAYYGGGVLLRYNDYCINCIYAEASARVGYSQNEWYDRGSALSELGDTNYTSGGVYVGTHVAVGYESDIAGVVGYDLYGKYYYNHQTGDGVGESVNFANTNSHRTRFGGRFDLRILQNIRPYIGMAWEHEYDSFANAILDDEMIPAPGVRGNTGIFELGVSDAHMSESSWSFDGSIQGYTGVRKGIGGMFRTHYVF